MAYKTLIFDYDGTIHESMTIYYQAFLKAYQYLVDNGLQESRVWTKDEVSKFLGQNPKEMWGSFQPKLSDKTIETVSLIVGEAMLESIKNRQAHLYDGALEVLETLKDKGYKLIYLSNSKTYYMQAHIEAFQLDRYFDKFVCSEMYNYIPKKDILKTFIHELDLPAIMIGDRIHDMETGYDNHIDTIACLYGYGDESEFIDATYKIENIKALLELL